jgi:hypothetical protein
MKRFFPICGATCVSLVIAGTISTVPPVAAEQFELSAEEVTDAALLETFQPSETEPTLLEANEDQENELIGHEIELAQRKIINQELRKLPRFARFGALEVIDYLDRPIPFYRKQVYDNDIPVTKDGEGNPVKADKSPEELVALSKRLKLTDNLDKLNVYEGVPQEFPVKQEGKPDGLRKSKTFFISPISPEIGRLIRGQVTPLAIEHSSVDTVDGNISLLWTMSVTRSMLKLFCLESTDGKSKSISIDITKDDTSLTIHTESEGITTTTKYSKEALLEARSQDAKREQDKLNR